MHLMYTAEEFYQCAIKSDKTNPYALNNCACLYLFRKKNHEKVIKYFEKAIKIDENNPTILLNFSIACKELGDAEKAQLYNDKYKEKRAVLRSISLSDGYY